MTAPHDPTIHEQLADHLQVAAPLVSRLVVMSKQNAVDAAAALERLEHAIALLRAFARDERERDRARRDQGGV